MPIISYSDPNSIFIARSGKIHSSFSHVVGTNKGKLLSIGFGLENPLKIYNFGYYDVSVLRKTLVEVKLWGAAGAHGIYNNAVPTNLYAGAGSFATTRMYLLPGITYKLVVGEGGGYAPLGNVSNVGGGGISAATNWGRTLYVGGGGGFSGIFVNSISQQNALIIAAGGGGGGNGSGGGGDQDGVSSPYSYAGYKGTLVAGGAGGSASAYGAGNAGSALQGGNSPTNGYGGGGGGGGYFGGGSGNSNNMPGGAGGGGSSYISSNENILSSFSTILTGNLMTPGNSSDPDRVTAGSVGFIRISNNIDPRGRNGAIIINVVQIT